VKTQRQKVKKAFLVVLLCMATTFVMAEDWTNTNLPSGTYVLRTVGSDNQFSVNGNGVYDNIGNIYVSSGTVTIFFSNSATIYLNGQIRVTGGTLNVKRGESCSASVALMRQTTFLNYCFYVRNSSTDVSECVLSIKGLSDAKHLVIDGGCGGLTIDEIAYNAACSGVQANQAFICIDGGTFDCF